MSDQLPPLPSPWAYVYVWRTQSGAFHRSFSAHHYNGQPCDDQEFAFTPDQMHAYARAAQALAYERVLAIVPANMPHDQPYRPVNLGWSQCAEFMRGMLSDFIYQAREAK